jgi:hypothetical protein
MIAQDEEYSRKRQHTPTNFSKGTVVVASMSFSCFNWVGANFNEKNNGKKMRETTC